MERFSNRTVSDIRDPDETNDEEPSEGQGLTAAAAVAAGVPGGDRKWNNGVFSHLIPKQNGFSPPRA